MLQLLLVLFVQLPQLLVALQSLQIRPKGHGQAAVVLVSTATTPPIQERFNPVPRLLAPVVRDAVLRVLPTTFNWPLFWVALLLMASPALHQVALRLTQKSGFRRI